MASVKKQREAALAAGAGGANTLLGASTTGRSARWIVSTDVALALDAVGLCELVSDVVLEMHRDAVLQGQRADGSGAQPPLSPFTEDGRAARAGKRPNLRGVTVAAKFPSGLHRTEVKVSGAKLASGRRGTRARATIKAKSNLKAWLDREAARGVGYFQVHGEVQKAVEDALLVWAEAEIRPTAPTRRAPK